MLCQLLASGRQLDIVEIMYWARWAVGTALSAFWFETAARTRKGWTAPGSATLPAVSRRFLGRIIVRDRNSGDVRRTSRRLSSAKWRRRRKNDVSPIYDTRAAKLSGDCAERVLTTDYPAKQCYLSRSQHNNCNTIVPLATHVVHWQVRAPALAYTLYLNSHSFTTG